MTVSVCPTFKCNQRCNYCYLGDKVCDSETLRISTLVHMLSKLCLKHSISRIDIFGGEVSLLSDDYLKELNFCCKSFASNVSVVTNLHRDISHIFKNITISLNEERTDFDAILNKLPTLPYDFALSIVVLPSIVNAFKSGKAQYMLNFIPRNCNSVHLVQYSQSHMQKHKIVVSDDDYEYVVFEACKMKKSGILPFKLQNLDDIQSQQYSPLMSESIFVLPSGEYAWISYQDHEEKFSTSYNLADYDAAVAKEYNIYKMKCEKCRYFQRCYTEHLDLSKQCSGHKQLLDMMYADNLLKAD